MAIMVLFGVAAWGYLWASGNYPFYSIWDMDLATVLDLIVIKSGLHPDHVNHPAFGMYLVLDVWTWLAKSFNLVSTTTLDSLARSMSPLAGVAELTDSVRAISPFVSLGAAFFLGMAILLWLRLPWRLAVLVFAVLLSQSSLLYHATMNRSELYAILFWGMGCCALAGWTQSVAPRSRGLWLFVAGVCLGLAILTKLQVVLYVVVTPFVLVFLLAVQGRRLTEEQGAPSGRADCGYRLAAWGNALAFSALLSLAWFVEPPEGVWSFTDRYKPTAYAIFFLLVFLACPVGLTFLHRRLSVAAQGLLHFLTILGAGFLSCSLFFFMVLPKPATSWQYLLVTYKMIFLRGALFVPKSLSLYLEQIAAYWRYEPWTLAVNGAALVFFLVWGRRRKCSLFVLLAAPALSCLVLGCALLSARPILRDWLWWEGILNAWTLILLLSPWATSARPGRAFAVVALAVLCLGNVRAGIEPLPRLDALYSQYGWNPRPWLSFVYFGAHQKYKRLVRERYGYPDDDAARQAKGPELGQASHHAAIRRMAAFPFPGRKVDLRHVSIAAPGFPVLHDDLALRLTDVPPQLAGAVVVDPLAAPAAGAFLAEPPKAVPTEEWAFAPYVPAPEVLTVVPRSDLAVWMFLPSEEPADGPVLELADASRKRRYVGQRVDHYQHCRIPPGSHPFFVVTGEFLP